MSSTSKVVDRETSQFVKTKNIKQKQCKGAIETKEECREKMLNLTTRFASYIKHKERGKTGGI